MGTGFLRRLTSPSNKNECDSITGSIVTAADRPVATKGEDHRR